MVDFFSMLSANQLPFEFNAHIEKIVSVECHEGVNLHFAVRQYISDHSIRSTERSVATRRFSKLIEAVLDYLGAILVIW